MSEKKPENPHAFPLRATAYSAHPGMTLRDYFAAKAIAEAMRQCAAFNDHPTTKAHGFVVDCGHAATLAYEMADAMLRAREAKP